MSIAPPQSISQLRLRAESMAGLSVGQLAQTVKVPIPADLSKHKGWLGQLLEHYLGASAGSLAAPDFEHLQVELKTIPVDIHGKARESTYVCTAPLCNLTGVTWQTAWVRKKLSHVLWVPVITQDNIALADRQIGMPLLWQPTVAEDALLASDWQLLTDMICLGQLEQMTAHHGHILQIRPKAANAKAQCWGINAQGERFLTLPRGFYLRARFTSELLKSHFNLYV